MSKSPEGVTAPDREMTIFEQLAEDKRRSRALAQHIREYLDYRDRGVLCVETAKLLARLKEIANELE